jgi:DNA adenine methylase
MGNIPLSKTTSLQPFIKWVGGKRSLAPLIRDIAGISDKRKFDGYFEPFLGGAAMFYDLMASGSLEVARAAGRVHLSDVNEPLIVTYRAVRASVEPLIKALEGHRHSHYKDLELACPADKGRSERGGVTAKRGSRSSLYVHYLQVRDEYNKIKQEIKIGFDEAVSQDEVKLAAMFLYLNRAGFNGMYRENSKGEMNIPPGRYTNPEIVNREVLERCSAALEGVVLRARPFDAAIAKAGKGDLVYLDPPYFDTFTGYAKGGFNRDAQEELAKAAKAAVGRGASVIISNSDTDEMRELYDKYGFSVGEVQAARNINSDGSGRAKVTEIVAYNVR